MLFSEPKIRLYLKAKRLGWAGHVGRAVESLTRNVLIKNPPQKSDQKEDLVRDVDYSKRLDDGMDRNGQRNWAEACKRPKCIA